MGIATGRRVGENKAAQGSFKVSLA